MACPRCFDSSYDGAACCNCRYFGEKISQAHYVLYIDGRDNRRLGPFESIEAATSCGWDMEETGEASYSLMYSVSPGGEEVLVGVSSRTGRVEPPKYSVFLADDDGNRTYYGIDSVIEAEKFARRKIRSGECRSATIRLVFSRHIKFVW